MSKWKDDGDYWTKVYDNKKKKRVIGRVSIKKGTNPFFESYLEYHAKKNHKGGS